MVHIKVLEVFMSSPVNNKPTIVPTELDYAYAAGIIDGEGNVSIRKKALRKGRRTRDIHTEVIISITHRPVLEWFQARWGGGIFLQRPGDEQYSHWQNLYRWTLYSERAGIFLCGILPFVIVKEPQVTLAIEFQTRMEKEWGSNRYHLGSKGFRSLPDEVLDLRESYFDRMQVLNIMGRGVEERAAVMKVRERKAKTLATGLSTAE
jgi:hypothetical protein